MPRQGSVGPRERPADGGAETIRKQDGGLERLVRAVKMFPHGLHSSRAKDFKTLVLAAFLRYFLPLLAESTPSEAWQGVRWAAGHMGPALQI